MWFFEIFKMKIGYPSWRSKVSPSARAEQNTNFCVSNRNIVMFILKLTTMKKYAQNWKNFTNRSSGSDFRDHYVNPIWPPICLFSQYPIFFQKSKRNIAMSHTILIRLRRGIWKIMYNDSFLNNHTRKLRKYTYLFRKHISAIHVLHSFHVFIVLKSFSKMVTNDNPHVPGGSPGNKKS